MRELYKKRMRPNLEETIIYFKKLSQVYLVYSPYCDSFFYYQERDSLVKGIFFTEKDYTGLKRMVGHAPFNF